jgi:hypothetical protein
VGGLRFHYHQNALFRTFSESWFWSKMKAPENTFQLF